jgi:hypothetical protein
MSETTLSPELSARLGEAANRALDASIDTYLVRRQRKRERGSAEQRKVLEALLRLAIPDHSQDLPSSASSLEQAISELRSGGLSPQPELPRSPIAQAAALRPYRIPADELNRVPQAIPEDTTLQILAPPYVDKWTSQNFSGNAQGNVAADPQTGDISFWHAAANGSAASGAGVWAQFIPDGGPRLVQVRSYLPYSYLWNDNSQDGYTAHNYAEFGVYVLSWDLRGNNQRVEQNFSYQVWSNSTGWWDNADDSGYGYAYLYGHEPPYFEASHNRIYRAAIFCSGSIQASGGFFGQALSGGQISGHVGFVVVGEQ